MIDPSVGIDHVLPLGTAVGRGDVIARVHANRLDRVQAAVKALENIILMDDVAMDDPTLILEQIGL